MIDFTALLEKDIQREVDERSKRERSGKFSPSRMGRCYLYQVLNRLNVPETDPIEMAVYKKFRAGNIYHRDLQSLVNNTEVLYEDDNFKCLADHVGEDYVVDFKTVFSSQFKVMVNQSHDQIVADKQNYVIQLMTYCHFLNKPIGYLVFVNKDDYDIIQVELKLEEYLPLVTDEINNLKGFWMKYQSTGKLPPCQPRCYINKKSGKSMERQYCNYRSSEYCGECK
jgi:hypothetical protein